MKSRARYFDAGGNEVDQSAALRNGVLKDHFSIRISTQFRDAAASKHKPLITDAYGSSGLALQRPGFRLRTDTSRKQIVEDCYTKYEREITHRYKCVDGSKQCPDCGGSGEDDDGATCDTCHGKGTVSEAEDERKEGRSLFGSGNGHGRSDDSLTLDQRRQAIAEMHRELDAELQNAWRNR